MDKEFYGSELIEFSNSWLFSPMIWDVLLDKYMSQRKMQLFNGERAGFMSSIMADKSLNSDLNDCINKCNNLSDRIAWEMSNQQIFFTKDKLDVANAIREFVQKNKHYNRNSDGICPLEQEHIIKHFNEIAEVIEQLQEAENPYFIFKTSSADDDVEYWFSEYSEEEKEYIPRSLKTVEKVVAEFVSLTGAGGMEFIMVPREGKENK